MSKRAFAYVCDIILGRTGEVISRQYQKELIQKYAIENDIEIVRWFEDEKYEEDVLSRSGVRNMMDCPDCCDMILVERVWALSRSWATLKTVFAAMDARGMAMESTTTMWDCVSQMCRRRFDDSLVGPRHKREMVERSEVRTAPVQKPQRLVFSLLNKNAARA